MLTDTDETAGRTEKSSPFLGFITKPDPVFEQHQQFMRDLTLLLQRSGARIEEGAIVLGSLKLVVEQDLFIKAHEEIYIKSGGDKRSDGRLNSVHINPPLDKQDRLKHRHVPFSQRRLRAMPKRPKRAGCGCGCGKH